MHEEVVILSVFFEAFVFVKSAEGPPVPGELEVLGPVWDA